MSWPCPLRIHNGRYWFSRSHTAMWPALSDETPAPVEMVASKGAMELLLVGPPLPVLVMLQRRRDTSEGVYKVFTNSGSQHPPEADLADSSPSPWIEHELKSQILTVLSFEPVASTHSQLGLHDTLST